MSTYVGKSVTVASMEAFLSTLRNNGLTGEDEIFFCSSDDAGADEKNLVYIYFVTQTEVPLYPVVTPQDAV